MAELDALQARMKHLEAGISAAREKLALHSSLHEDHAATLDELTEHYRHLQHRLNSENATLASEGVHIDSFEKTVLNWINGLTFSH